MWKKEPIHYSAIAVGVCAATVEGYSNIEHIHSAVNNYTDPSIFAAAITSVGAAVLLAFAIKSFKRMNVAGAFIGVGLILTLAFTAAYTMSTTLDRTSAVRLQKLTKIAEGDVKYQEMLKIYKAIASRTVEECGKGVGERCRNNKSGLAATENDMRNRLSELDTMGQQVRWMMSSIGIDTDVETAGKIAPMFLPVALFLLGMFCIAFGEKGSWVEPEKPEFDDNEITSNNTVEKEKAVRFVREYAARNNKYPPPAAVRQVIGCNNYHARKYIRMARRAA